MRKIQRAAKAAFTEDTELSAAMQVPLGGLGGLGVSLPQGFVATFKSLVVFVSRKKNFVPLCLCVKLKTLNSSFGSNFEPQSLRD